MGKITFGKMSFPDDVPGIVKDPKLFAVFQKYAKTAAIGESIEFLSTSFDPKTHYKYFIQDGARKQVNIADPTREPMDELALAKTPNWDKKAWQKHIIEAKKEIRDRVKRDHLLGKGGKFWKSAEFQAFLQDIVGKRIGKPMKAAEKLGISPRNTDLLHALMVAAAIGDKRMMDKHSYVLVKKEKMSVKPADLAAMAAKLT